MVEIGKGSKVKYELDKTSGLIKVWLPFSCIPLLHFLMLDVFAKYERLSFNRIVFSFTISKLCLY